MGIVCRSGRSISKSVQWDAIVIGVSCCGELSCPTSICSATLDAFTIVISSRSTVLDGDDTVDANVKDIKDDSFSFSF